MIIHIEYGSEAYNYGMRDHCHNRHEPIAQWIRDIGSCGRGCIKWDLTVFSCGAQKSMPWQEQLTDATTYLREYNAHPEIYAGVYSEELLVFAS